MSLVPYEEGSLILDDPNSKSVVVVNPTSGTLSFFQQNNSNDDSELNEDQTASLSALTFLQGFINTKALLLPMCARNVVRKLTLIL